MRQTTVAALLILTWGNAAALHAAPPEILRSYPSITLLDGRHFEAVEVVNYTTNGILVRHASGATVLPTTALPDAILSDLHLPPGESIANRGLDPAFLALANKPAVALDELALKPAVAAEPSTPASGADLSEKIATDLADATANAPAAVINSAPVLAPAGEGNIPEFFVDQTVVAGAAVATHVDVTGRVRVILPTGETQLLAGVEVCAYPAALLTRYLGEAEARGRDAAQRILTQADSAAQAGRLAEAVSLTAQARETAAHTIHYLPVAPFATKTDAHGLFTIRHDLRDARLVAVGYAKVDGKQWRYEWVGIRADREIILTEANATALAPPSEPARYASR